VSSLVATGIVAAPVAALASQGWSVNRLLNTCVGREGDQFPKLEQVAADTLSSMECAPAASAHARTQERLTPAIVVDVNTWTERSAANGFLTSLGWEKRDAVTYVSPDGEFRAQVVMTGEDGRASLYVTLYFKYA